MIRFGKRAAVLTAAGVLAAASVTGCSGSIDTDAVVATVGDEEITLGVANFYARLTQGQYETYYASMLGMTADTMWSQEVEEGTTYEDSTKDSLMESLENLYLMSQHAADYGVSLSEEEEEAIADAAQKFDEDNTEEAKEVVSGYRKDVEKYLELITISQKMDSKMREGVDEEVSDEEAAQKGMEYLYFSYTSTDEEGNSVELTDEEKETLKSTAQAAAESARDGEDMETLASENGLSVQTATFDSESTTPNSELVAAADALAAEGEVTDPVETDSGIYVAKLTSLLDREATDAEKETIVEQRRQDQYDSLLEEWRDAVEITVNEKVWNKVDFEDTGVTITTSETDETADEGTAVDGSTDESAADGATDSAAADENAAADDAGSSDDSAAE